MSSTEIEPIVGSTADGQATPAIPSFLELEITQFCQLQCVHCYSESGSHGGHARPRPSSCWPRRSSRVIE